MKKWLSITGVAILAVIIAIGAVIKSSDTGASKNQSTTKTMTQVMVGGDIHTLTITNGILEISGHENTSLSSDNGQTWSSINEIANADVMAWGMSGGTTYAGGHTGMYVKNSGETKFHPINFYKGITDIHALGMYDKYIYVGSPQVGFLSSLDGGKTWGLRNNQTGQGFMGTMLVDPKNPLRILAPDMQLGLMSSMDGGASWSPAGGPMGSMSIAWNPTNINEIAVLGMGSTQVTHDAGKTWSDISTPSNTAVITYSEDGKTLYAATLDAAPYAHIYQSNDLGKSWALLAADSVEKNASESTSVKTTAMDPNMPGMDHSSHAESVETAQRPLFQTLSIFGSLTALVMVSAFFLRRSDQRKLALKRATLQKSGAKK